MLPKSLLAVASMLLLACSGSVTSGASTDGGGGDDDLADATPPADAAPRIDGALPPPEFWDHTGIPAAQNVMMFKFLNRTNGKLDDAHVFWSFENANVHELHSIAEQPLYDMPANQSGRMYFYLCPSDEPASCVTDPSHSQYFDFIEHTIGANQYNGNTTRVDAFGVKIAMLLHCADGFEDFVGEDFDTFSEDRAVTFQKFIDEVPAEFDHLAQAPYAPYRIVEPGRGEFRVGGLYEHYYDAYVDEMWAANGITVTKPGSNGSGLGAYPDLSAAIFRHVGAAAGTFRADGSRIDQHLWDDASKFYPQAPANYYARFWHDHSLHGKAYGFPYDDVGSYSTYISHSDPDYLLVAIGW